MTLLFVDTETGGLDDAQHPLIELAWAFESGPVKSIVLPHDWRLADPEALRINRYFERKLYQADPAGNLVAVWLDVLKGSTLVCANPSFDERFLLAFARREWSDGPLDLQAPWKYRKWDVETMAATLFGWDELRGLQAIAQAMGESSPDVDAHSAAGDVDLMRRIFLRLRRASKLWPMVPDKAGLEAHSPSPWSYQRPGDGVKWDGD